MVTACAINALLRYCARRTQSTLPTEIPITEDGAGPGLVERHDIDAQEYLAPQETGACLNTLELYLMLCTASCRIRLGAPELLDVLIILNSAVNGDCNLTPKTMRLTLVAAIVIAAKRTQTASSSASVPSDMKIAGSAFSHLNLSRLLGTMLLVEHATDFQLAVLDDEQLRRQYTINLAKLAERERPAINMYLQRVPQMNLDIEATKNMRHDFQNTRPFAGAHSPVHSFKRARRLDLSPLSQQLFCDL
uniref:Uncharacterized protein n=1 Tax=Chrysotila carterae TaxID=13221 RepID=A0A7S4B317_CHRCT|mmetsp:Transcript_22248/g.48545  ORF Transcript_22248/g.48545 Transcript_22248/m.48545 type:complete len:248 (+) Transcript_22248:624-1367(+)